MNYQIVPYRPEFRDQVVSLQTHLVSPDVALNSAYFAWKHERNPYTAGPIAYLALAEDKVVGMRAFLGANWQCGANETTYLWLCACDLVVDPAHRGQGLVRKIMNYAMEDLASSGHSTVLNLSGSPITYLTSLRMGWRLVGSYKRWVRETGRGRRLRRLRSRMRRLPLVWRYAGASMPGLSRRGFQSLDRAWSGTPGLAREPRPQEMADLVDRVGSPGIRHVRNAEYYAWRFENPRRDYRYIFWPGETLEGFLVLQCSSRGTAAMNIVDWEASSAEIAQDMLRAVARAGGYDSLSIWSATLAEEIKHTLASLGFVPADDTRGIDNFDPGMLINPAIDGPSNTAPELADWDLSDLANWQLRMIFSDAF